MRSTNLGSRLWTKIFAGAPSRRSRFHDQDGKLIPLGRLLRNGPVALFSTILRVLTSHLPPKPWLSYDGQQQLAAHLTPTSSVLEFGSGMSTRWLLERSGSVLSFEDTAGWYERVRAQLPPRAKIRYILAQTPGDYTAVPGGELFDLVLVDGRWRDQCVAVGLQHLKPGGVLYLDNSDKYADDHCGDVPRAVRLMQNAALSNGWELREFTDFAPALFFAQSALMLLKSKET